MIGELRHKVTIKRPVVTADNYGGQSVANHTLKTVWGQVKTASGAEGIANGAVQNTQSRILILRRCDILASDLVVLGGEEWLVSDVEELKDKPFYLQVSIRRKSVTGG